MEVVMAVLIGLGLAAACGLRVFVPLLVLSIATRIGAVSLGTGVHWVGTTEAMIALGVASVLEIVAYKVPWLDHVLDTIASPAAVIAGTIVAASQVGQVTDVSPLLRWSAALIAGGGIAGIVQTGTVSTRAASTVTTAGIANPIISALQSVASVIMSIIAVVAPILAGILVVLLLFIAVAVVVKFRRWRNASRRCEPAPI